MFQPFARKTIAGDNLPMRVKSPVSSAAIFTPATKLIA
jgi:hypothetical protein